MLQFLFRLMFPAWMTQPVIVQGGQFRPFYLAWLIGLIIILTCVAGLFLGIIPGSDKLWFALIGLLAITVYFR